MPPDGSFSAAPGDALAEAETLVARALDPAIGPAALVSSFGAESAVLLHMVARRAPATPVLFLDTGMLFPETLAYRRELVARLGLGDVRAIGPEPGDRDGLLHRRDPDACCALRKTRPLERALAGFAVWISGRKRFHGGRRSDLPAIERDAAGRLKVNPLAGWATGDIADYMTRHDLPRHPLVARGYASIGCAPCTTPVRAGEDPRAGRWRGRDKTECGIHFDGGRAVRTGEENRT